MPRQKSVGTEPGVEVFLLTFPLIGHSEKRGSTSRDLAAIDLEPVSIRVEFPRCFQIAKSIGLELTPKSRT
jgi:hypothetical protein